MGKIIFRDFFGANNFKNKLCLCLEKDGDKFYFVNPETNSRREVVMIDFNKGGFVKAFIYKGTNEIVTHNLNTEATSLILDRADFDKFRVLVETNATENNEPKQGTTKKPVAPVTPTPKKEEPKSVTTTPKKEEPKPVVKPVDKKPGTQTGLQPEKKVEPKPVVKPTEKKPVTKKEEPKPVVTKKPEEKKPVEKKPATTQPKGTSTTTKKPVTKKEEPKPVTTTPKKEEPKPVVKPTEKKPEEKKPEVKKPEEKKPTTVKPATKKKQPAAKKPTEKKPTGTVEDSIPFDFSSRFHMEPKTNKNRYIYSYDFTDSSRINGNVEVFKFSSADRSGSDIALTSVNGKPITHIYEVWENSERKYICSTRDLTKLFDIKGQLNLAKMEDLKRSGDLYVNSKNEAKLSMTEMEELVGGPLQDNSLDIVLKNGTKIKTVYYPYDEARNTCDGWAVARTIDKDGKPIFYYAEIPENSPIDQKATPEQIGEKYNWQEISNLRHNVIRKGFFGKLSRMGNPAREELVFNTPNGDKVTKQLRTAKSPSDRRARQQMNRLISSGKGTVKYKDGALGKTGGRILFSFCTLALALFMSFTGYASISPENPTESAKSYLSDSSRYVHVMDNLGENLYDNVYENNGNVEVQMGAKVADETVSEESIIRQEIAEDALARLGDTVIFRSKNDSLITSLNAKEVSAMSSAKHAFNIAGGDFFNFNAYGEHFYDEIGYRLGQQAGCYAFADGHEEINDEVLDNYMVYLNSEEGVSIVSEAKLKAVLGEEAAVSYITGYERGLSDQLTYLVKSNNINTPGNEGPGQENPGHQDPGQQDPGQQGPQTPVTEFENVLVNEYYTTTLNDLLTDVVNSRADTVSSDLREDFVSLNANINYVKLQNGELVIGFKDMNNILGDMYEVSYDVSKFNLDVSNLKAQDLENVIRLEFANANKYSCAQDLSIGDKYDTRLENFANQVGMYVNENISASNVYFEFVHSNESARDVYTMNVLVVTDSGVPYKINNFARVTGAERFSLSEKEAQEFCLARFAGVIGASLEGMESSTGFKFNEENIETKPTILTQVSVEKSKENTDVTEKNNVQENQAEEDMIIETKSGKIRVAFPELTK